MSLHRLTCILYINTGIVIVTFLGSMFYLWVFFMMTNTHSIHKRLTFQSDGDCKPCEFCSILGAIQMFLPPMNTRLFLIYKNSIKRTNSSSKAQATLLSLLTRASYCSRIIDYFK